MVRVSPGNGQAVFVSVTHDYKIFTRCYIRPLWSGGRYFTKKKKRKKFEESNSHQNQGHAQRMWRWSVLRVGWITTWCAWKQHARWRPNKSTSTIWTHSIENENLFPSLKIVSVEQSFSKSKSFSGCSRNSPH